MKLALLASLLGPSFVFGVQAAHAAEASVADCAAATRSFAAQKASFDTQPESRLGQILAATVPPVLGAMKGSLTGYGTAALVKKPVDKAIGKVNKTIEQLRQVNAFRVEYNRLLAESFRIGSAMNELVPNSPYNQALRESLARAEAESLSAGENAEQYRARARKLLLGMDASKRSQYESARVELYQLKVAGTENANAEKLLVESSEFKSLAGKYTFSPSVYGTTDVDKFAEINGIKVPRIAKFLNRYFTPKVGSAVGAVKGGVVGAIIGESGKAAVVAFKCDLGLFSGEIGVLAPYVTASIAGPCQFTSQGALALATATPETLEKLCRDAPDLPLVMAKLNEQHQASVAKIAAPLNTDLSCANGGVGSFSFSAKGSDEVERKYTFDAKALDRFRGTVTDVFDSGSEKDFSYELGFDPNTNEFGEAGSPKLRGAPIQRLDGFDSKSLQRYRATLGELIPIDPRQRRAYFIGTGLQYAEPLMKSAELACADAKGEGSKPSGAGVNSTGNSAAPR
jgi:hypothetical protein